METRLRRMMGMLGVGLLGLPCSALALQGNLPDLVQRVEVGLRETSRTRLEPVPGVRGTYLLAVVDPPRSFFLDLRQEQGQLLEEVRLVERTARLSRVRLTLRRPELALVGLELSRPRRLLLEIADPPLLQGGSGDTRLPVTLLQVLPAPLHPMRPALETLLDSTAGPSTPELQQALQLQREGRPWEALEQLRLLRRGEKIHTAAGIDALFLELCLQAELREDRAGLAEQAQLLTSAIDRAPDHPLALLARLLLAQARRRLGQLEEAARAYAACIEAGTASPLGGICRIEAADLALRRDRDSELADLLQPYPEEGGEAELSGELPSYARVLWALLRYRRGEAALAGRLLGGVLGREAWMGHRHPELIFLLAETLLVQDHDEVAGPVYEQLAGPGGNEPSPGRPQPRLELRLPPEVLDLVELRLGDLAARQGRQKQAEERWARLAAARKGSLGARLAAVRRAPSASSASTLMRSLLSLMLDETPQLGLEAGMRLALLLWSEDRFDQAWDVLAELERAFPYHGYRSGGLGWLWPRVDFLRHAWPVRQGRYLEVANRFLQDGSSLAGSVEEAQQLLLIGRALQQVGLPGQAALALQESLPRIEGTSGEQLLLRELARSYLLQNKEYQAAKVLEYLAVRHPRPADPAAVAVLKAEGARLRRDAAEEETQLKQALLQGDEDPQLELRLARLLVRRQARPEALVLLTRALEAAPAGTALAWAVQASLERAEALRDLHQLQPAALAYAEAAARAGEGSADRGWALFRQGEALLQAGDEPGAQQVWEQAAAGGGTWAEASSRALRELAFDREFRALQAGSGQADKGSEVAR